MTNSSLTERRKGRDAFETSRLFHLRLLKRRGQAAREIATPSSAFADRKSGRFKKRQPSRRVRHDRRRADAGRASVFDAKRLASFARLDVEVVNRFHILEEESDWDDDDACQGRIVSLVVAEEGAYVRLEPRDERRAAAALERESGVESDMAKARAERLWELFRLCRNLKGERGRGKGPVGFDER